MGCVVGVLSRPAQRRRVRSGPCPLRRSVRGLCHRRQQAGLCYPARAPRSEVPAAVWVLAGWARSMRQPSADIAWPGWQLTVGMVKPGSDPLTVGEPLTRSHTVLEQFQRSLTPADVRRLYPDAYGRDYVADRDDYLISAPVTVFVLHASPSAIGKAKDIKGAIRSQLGDTDMLRNHLHMPDNPGDAFADLDHLAGAETFRRLYERYDRDRAAQRLARYRTLLEQPNPRPRAG